MAVMGMAMLITGVVASRIGPKRTLLLGLVVIIAGAGLAGMSDTVMGIVGWRALWGLGNALFIATALATIANSARVRSPRRSSCTRRRSGWGVALAFTSVVGAPRLQRRFGTVRNTFGQPAVR